jgi:hypothetical protein
MSRKTLFLIGILFSFASIGQKNLAYLELGGNGLFISLNYERKILPGTNIYSHAGLGIYGINKTHITVPFGLNYLFGLQPDHFIDFGVGLTYTTADVKLYAIVDKKDPSSETHAFNFVPSLGYRWHDKKKWMYRFSFTPVFNQYDGLPFAGFSLGKLF